MRLLQEKFFPGILAGGEPGAAARQIFENFDFGDLDIMDFDGADSVVQVGTPNATSTIKFYVPSTPPSERSCVMTFRVEFDKSGALVSVYD